MKLEPERVGAWIGYGAGAYWRESVKRESNWIKDACSFVSITKWRGIYKPIY